MTKNIFPPWPFYSEDEAEKVKSVLLSNQVNYWTGKECRKFEREFSEYINTKFAVALANGTVALDAAFQAIGLNANDEVIVTSRTFIASVSSIINAGLRPVFADVNPLSQNIDVNTIRAVLSEKTRAILCVHLAGWPCDMDPIMELAQKLNLWVIEDCAQAVGAKYKGQSVGSIGDVGCWSFCQDKIITTGGEGGMVTTNNEQLWTKIWSYKDHGKSWESVYKKRHPPGFRWLHDSFGTNWRMTEMQAAIGRIQLKRMPEWHQLRNIYMKQIWVAADSVPCLRSAQTFCDGCDTSCTEKNGCSHAAYKCYVFVNGSRKRRDAIMAFLNSQGVPCFEGSCSEVYLERAFSNTNLKPKKRLQVAKKLGETSLMFLCHPSLRQEDIDKTCLAIKKACTVSMNSSD